jgi:hypothetical protein
MTWPDISPYLPGGLTPEEFYHGAVISFCALVGVSLLFAVWNVWVVAPRPRRQRRGRRLLTLVFRFLAFRSWNKSTRKPEDVRIMMCAAEVKMSAVEFPYLALGATGSGKSISKRLHYQSVLPHIGRGLGFRAMIYDHQTEEMSILGGLKLSCPVRTFHPWDRRGVSWAMWRDVTTPAEALGMAQVLVPVDPKDRDKFWSIAARSLLFGVIYTYLVLGGRWYLRDLVWAMESEESLRYVLGQTRLGRRLIRKYLTNRRLAQNVLATVEAHMLDYYFVAAGWDQATEEVSLTDWAYSESILILPHSHVAEPALSALVRIIFTRATQILMAKPKAETRGKSWLYLDEFPLMGKLNLPEVALTGRGKNIGLHLDTQGVEMVREVYGPRAGDALLSQCRNLAVFGLNSEETAKWAAGIFGDWEGPELSRQVSTNSRGEETVSIGWPIQRRPSVIDSDLLKIGPVNKDNGLVGYYIVPEIGAYTTTIPHDWLVKNLQPADPVSAPDFIPRGKEADDLVPWKRKDLKRLKLPLPEEPEGGGKKKGPPTKPEPPLPDDLWKKLSGDN